MLFESTALQIQFEWSFFSSVILWFRFVFLPDQHHAESSLQSRIDCRFSHDFPTSIYSPPTSYSGLFPSGGPTYQVGKIRLLDLQTLANLI